ncbi:TPA: hypothetical protein ACPSKY_003222 [Legionella bozemanae]|uniref:hypothetical protein n=1 Tax=Legionella bozemanae TaxID=447 RepID=UPI0013EFAD7C|nr:hypothetical protein [Legionella bozemanae]
MHEAYESRKKKQSKETIQGMASCSTHTAGLGVAFGFTDCSLVRNSSPPVRG